jgi:hypothetical protein
VRERSYKLVRELVLDDPAPFAPFFLTKRKKEIDYEAKAVTLAGRRYIVCRNHDQMRKDAAARAAILAALEREVKKGDKALVGNKGYRRFLTKPDDGHFAIDPAKAEEDAKFDGVFVLRTPGCRRSKRCSSTSRATLKNQGLAGWGSSSLIVHSSGRRWGTALGARPRSVQCRSRHAAPSGH